MRTAIPERHQAYELVLPFGELPVGTVVVPTGEVALDFLDDGRTASVRVEVNGKTRWLRERADGPLRVRKVTTA